jgi:peptidyl-prolyl cis-trans isomerase C
MKRIVRPRAGAPRRPLALALLGAVLLVVVLAGCGPAGASGPVMVASVNGHGISLDDFVAARTYFLENSVLQGTASDWQSPGGRPNYGAAQAQALDFLISVELMRQQLANCHVSVPQSVITKYTNQLNANIKQAQKSSDPSQRAIVRALTPQMQQVLVNQGAYQELLTKNVKVPGAQVRVIVVATKAQAQQLAQQAQQGADFAQLAKANSSDQSSSSGGDVGTVYPGVIEAAVPGFDKQAFGAAQAATGDAPCYAHNTYKSTGTRYVILPFNGKYALFQIAQLGDHALASIASQSQQGQFSAWLNGTVLAHARVDRYVAPPTTEQPAQQSGQ